MDGVVSNGLAITGMCSNMNRLVSIMGFAAFFLDLFFLEETYPPVILVSKAAELRRRTKNWGIHAKQEEIEIDFRELINKNFSRPIESYSLSQLSCYYRYTWPLFTVYYISSLLPTPSYSNKSMVSPLVLADFHTSE